MRARKREPRHFTAGLGAVAGSARQQRMSRLRGLLRRPSARAHARLVEDADDLQRHEAVRGHVDGFADLGGQKKRRREGAGAGQTSQRRSGGNIAAGGTGGAAVRVGCGRCGYLGQEVRLLWVTSVQSVLALTVARGGDQGGGSSKGALQRRYADPGGREQFRVAPERSLGAPRSMPLAQ